MFIDWRVPNQDEKSGVTSGRFMEEREYALIFGDYFVPHLTVFVCLAIRVVLSATLHCSFQIEQECFARLATGEMLLKFVTHFGVKSFVEIFGE
jgi:hypothetical protein